ncbi:MAG: hypothetical protein PQJ50_03460 [Spirochaetales bacterium]|nr:hypothetical protein [Spirochaetales bacterium]
MNKKVLLLVSLILLLGGGALFAETGLGLSFGYGYGYGQASNIALSIDSDVIPGSVQNVSLRIDGSYFGIGLTDDWYLVDDMIDGPFGWYFGVGFYANVGFYDDIAFAFGARAPIGLDLTVLDNKLRFFLEIAPALGLGFDPDFYFPDWDITGAFGFRFYF